MTWIYGGLVGGALLACLCAVSAMDLARHQKEGSQERHNIALLYLFGPLFFAIVVGGIVLKFS